MKRGKMPESASQQLIPFEETPVAATLPERHSIAETILSRYEPSEEALEAFERLEGWLLDARGKPISDLAELTLRALGKAMLEGKNGWHHAAEDCLEALLLDPALAGEKEFRQVVDEVTDCLHERMFDRGR